MLLLEGYPGLLDAVRGEMTPKFLATRSAAGMPNVVPLISLLPADDQPDVLFFGNFLLRKSIQNLKDDRRVGMMIITEALHGWVLRGDFVEFQRTGPYVERQASSSLLRYNAYTGIRDAGLIRVCSVDAVFAISKAAVLRDYVLARLGALLTGRGGGQATGKAVRVPRPVKKEFSRIAAVKALAWIGPDGYPIMRPALSLQPAGPAALACRKYGGRAAANGYPPDGAAVAANVLTLDAVSYQAKGTWSGRGPLGTGAILVQEVYAGGPPIPGGRVA